VPKEMKHSVANYLVTQPILGPPLSLFLSSIFSISTTCLEDLCTGLQSNDSDYCMARASAESARQPRRQSRKGSLPAVLVTVARATSEQINQITGPADLTDILSCYVVNARSLKKPNALQLLQTEMFACMCDVTAVTETLLSKAVDSTAIQFDGYTLH